MRQGNADRIIDLCGGGECRIEVLPIKLTHQLKADLAWNFPVKFSAGKFTGRLAANMDREWRRCRMKELLGVIVGKYDPKVGIKLTQLAADVGRDFAHMRDDGLVFCFRHGEELRRMGQHGAADHSRHHGHSPLPKNIPRHKRQQGKRRGSRASLPRFPCRVQAGTLWSVSGMPTHWWKPRREK